ncbi:RNA polymerase factor sigma-54 [Prolixibacter sp. SD074]|jgi:RNA polymerase sigma-54 factor|uniref:RNA polymerase factor sigma-54 n=1 Tax=Prolixibacter sp. SD074 TaxID=2652391 RepID=UPI00128698F6|nr:RNA polymerase factor sigma-54 [Prolixibacter sp. SD074]GET30411.1 RNA polymerase sigma-54 factor [Prolixibacter sp. SD074]
MQKLSLQQKLLQKLSPQQIQVIKLLEVPTMQLEQRIKKELEENPVLDLDNESSDSEEEEYDNELKSNDDKDNEEFSVDDYLNDEDYPSYKYTSQNYSKDDKFTEIPFSAGASFHEFVEQQLTEVSLSEDELVLAEQIIGNIDEDGYLRRDLESIMDDLAFMQNVTTDEPELLRILRVIQEFDPPGVGARNLRECLRLQIERKDLSKPEIQLASRVLRDTFDEFTRKHYDKITRKFGISEDELKKAIDEILKLNPKPGSSFSNTINRTNQTIIPDFILELVDGDLQLSLNQRNVPDLHINGHYANMLKAYQENKKNLSRQDKDTVMFMKQKLDSAKWFIDAIRQRQQTLLLVMNEIIDYQKEYFMEGDETRLHPMILKDIAERTGLDISTVSRVSNSKYIQTHFGIFPLKYFFSESMQKDTGEEVSTREIKQILKECIEGEDKRKPLTDQALAEILKQKSYPIARRTVAKYREQMDIPVARMRKEL